MLLLHLKYATTRAGNACYTKLRKYRFFYVRHYHNRTKKYFFIIKTRCKHKSCNFKYLHFWLKMHQTRPFMWFRLWVIHWWYQQHVRRHVKIRTSSMINFEEKAGKNKVHVLLMNIMMRYIALYGEVEMTVIQVCPISVEHCHKMTP